jgi:ketosteroid isomerase-like protein
MSREHDKTGLPHEDVVAIEKLVRLHFDLACAGNWQRWVDRCADSILLLPPGEHQISGREAARRWLCAFPPIGEIRGNVPTIRGNGRLAFATGTVLVSNGTHDEEQHGYTKWLAVYEKDQSGRWSMVADIWNDDPAEEG